MNNKHTTTHNNNYTAGGVSFIMKEQNEEKKEIIIKNLKKMDRHLKIMDELAEKELFTIAKHIEGTNDKKTRNKLINIYDKYLKCLVVLEKCLNKLEEIEEAKINFHPTLRHQLNSKFNGIQEKIIKYKLNKIFNN